MFLKGGERKSPRQIKDMANKLPQQQINPVENQALSFGKNRWSTNDLTPPSVTEGTTKLLQED
jgi:hypothetical protein